MKAVSKIIILSISFVMAATILFLIGTSVGAQSANNFSVRWYDCNYGLTQNSCKADIQNLDAATSRDFNLSVLVSNTSYSIDSFITKVTIKEWKILPTEIPTYNTRLVSKTCYNRDNTTSTSTSYDCSYSETYQNGTEIKNVAQWKATKTNMLKEGAVQKMYYGTINIPKFGSKQNLDDYGNVETNNGIKTFLVEWTTPIIKSESGYGSSGKIAFVDESNGQEYHPWWNSSWSYKKQINITAVSMLPAGYTMNITWDMTQPNILNTGNDTRMVIDDGTNIIEVDRNITNVGTATAFIEFKLNSQINAGISNASYYIYYGNPSAGNPPNNKTKIYALADDFNEFNHDGLWQYDKKGSAAYSVFGGELQMSVTSATLDAVKINTTFNFSENYTTEFRYKTTATGSKSYMITGWSDTITEGNTGGVRDIWGNEASLLHDSSGNILYGETIKGGAEYTTMLLDHLFTSYRTYKVLWNSTNTTIYVDGKENATAKFALAASSLPFIFKLATQNDGGFARNATYDWVVVRRWVESSPTYTIGAETQKTNAAKAVYIDLINHPYTTLDNMVSTANQWKIPSLTTYGGATSYINISKLGMPSNAEIVIVYTNPATGTNKIALTSNGIPQSAGTTPATISSSEVTLANNETYPQTIIKSINPSELGISGIFIQPMLYLANQNIGPNIYTMQLILYY